VVEVLVNWNGSGFRVKLYAAPFTSHTKLSAGAELLLVTRTVTGEQPSESEMEKAAVGRGFTLTTLLAALLHPNGVVVVRLTVKVWVELVLFR
jgi:hypothetical protein